MATSASVSASAATERPADTAKGLLGATVGDAVDAAASLIEVSAGGRTGSGVLRRVTSAVRSHCGVSGDASPPSSMAAALLVHEVGAGEGGSCSCSGGGCSCCRDGGRLMRGADGRSIGGAVSRRRFCFCAS